jgi:hypothetical protein
MQSIASIRIRMLSAVRGCFVLAGLLSALIFISCADGMAQSDQVVARGVKTFFEAWLKRELRGDELRQVTDEFIAYHTRKGKDRAGIDEAAKLLQGYAKTLREHDGCPGGITFRHNMIEANYFDPDMQNTTELRLLLEPDPVRVVNQRRKQLITERDVVALANICAFTANSDGEPRSQKVDRKKIDAMTIELERAFEDDFMDMYLREPAELWAGIQREWPNLSTEQKRKVRAYAAKGYLAPMGMDEYKLYARLLDLDDGAALDRARNDFFTASFRVTLELQNYRNLLDTLRKMDYLRNGPR